MKNLQNNYTTPKQSKQLLELGVPADSADCYYNSGRYANTPTVMGDKTGRQYEMICGKLIPCWSVGRLIEIYEICSGKKYERKSARLVREGNVSVMKELTIIEDVIGDIVNARLYIYPHIDFSKLED